MTRYRHIEDDHQASYFKWVRLMEKADPRYYNIIAIPNGGRRDVREAARMKAGGVKAGVSDIFVSVPCGGFHGLWIELKRPKVKNQSAPVVSAEQKAWQAAQGELGYAVSVCYGWEQAKTVTEFYFHKGAP